jgi:hypothetical protein
MRSGSNFDNNMCVCVCVCVCGGGGGGDYRVVVGPRPFIYATGGTLELEERMKFMIIVVLFCSNTICHIKSEIILKGKNDGLVRTQRKTVTYFHCCPKCTYGIPFILGATFNSAFSFCLWCLTVQCKRDQSQVDNNKRTFTGL